MNINTGNRYFLLTYVWNGCVSGNGDDGLDRIKVTSPLAVCCVTAPGTGAIVLSSRSKEVRRAWHLHDGAGDQDIDYSTRTGRFSFVSLHRNRFGTTVFERYSCRRIH
jgi:hypothetical protein